MTAHRTRLLLAAVALALAACGSKEDRVDSGLKKGAAFVRQSDWDKASVELRNVLQIDPKNARAYLIAAQVSEGQREPQRAYGQYLKAVELKPDLLEAKGGLARLYLVTGDHNRADATVKDVLAADPKNALARTLQAALLAAAGDSVQAQAVAREVLASDVGAPADTSLLLAGLHANAREWPQALAVLESALAKDPKHLGLLQAAVEVAGANPQDTAMSAKAVGFFQRATEASPRNHDLWLAWTRFYLGRKETDRAEAVMRAAIQAHPEDGKRRLALLDFLVSTRGAAVAEREYLAAIKDKSRDMALRFGLANLYRSTNRPAEAQRVLAEIIDLSDDTPSLVAARAQLAGYRFAAGKTDEARALVEGVLKANPRDNAALVLRGRLHLAASNPQDAVADLRGALRDQPASPEIVQLLAQAHRAAGEPALARDVLAEAAKLRPLDVGLRTLLVADMAGAKDLVQAHAELDTAIRALPQATRLYELKSELAIAQSDFALAQKTLEQLRSQQPKEALAHVRLGQLFSRQNRFDAALKAYDAGIAAAPADPTPYVAGVSLLMGLKRHDEALARIQARAKTEPNNHAMHLQLRGEVMLARRDFVGAEAAYREAVQLAPQMVNAHAGLSKVLAAKGDPEAALQSLAAGERALPAERALPLARAQWLTRLKRTDEAIALYEQLSQRFPDDDVIVNNLAYLLAEVRGDKVSVERALQLAGRFAESRNAGHLDSLGWIHYRLGQYDKALPLLERAVALAPPSPLLQLHLGKALVKAGDPARGRELIRKAIDSKADLPRLDEARALLAQG